MNPSNKVTEFTKKEAAECFSRLNFRRKYPKIPKKTEFLPKHGPFAFFPPDGGTVKEYMSSIWQLCLSAL